MIIATKDGCLISGTVHNFKDFRTKESGGVNFSVLYKYEKENSKFMDCTAWGMSSEQFKGIRSIVAVGMIQVHEYEGKNYNKLIIEKIIDTQKSDEKPAKPEKKAKANSESLSDFIEL